MLTRSPTWVPLDRKRVNVVWSELSGLCDAGESRQISVVVLWFSVGLKCREGGRGPAQFLVCTALLPSLASRVAGFLELTRMQLRIALDLF